MSIKEQVKARLFEGQRIKPNATYEITNTDSGTTVTMKGKEAIKQFGKDEFLEMLQGFLPNWVVVEL